LGKLIGRGGFGTVHKGLNLNTGRIVAIKRFHAAKIAKVKLAGIMVKSPLRYHASPALLNISALCTLTE